MHWQREIWRGERANITERHAQISRKRIYRRTLRKKIETDWDRRRKKKWWWWRWRHVIIGLVNTQEHFWIYWKIIKHYTRNKTICQSFYVVYSTDIIYMKIHILSSKYFLSVFLKYVLEEHDFNDGGKLFHVIPPE